LLAPRVFASSPLILKPTQRLAHRYALTLDIDTLVLGVKNRQELADCVAAAEAGPLPAELVNQIDR
jgi:hypothetical protein